MVRTRAGTDVVHTADSYGRAANIESRRRRKKRKQEMNAATRQSSTNTAASTTPQQRTKTWATRLQIESEYELATPPSASIRVGITPPPSPNSERLLRRASASTTRSPRCSNFGTARHFAFKGQGYLFCSACDLWDALPPDASKEILMNSLRFGCKADHKYFSHPTTLRKQDCFSGRRRRVAADEVRSRGAGLLMEDMEMNNTGASESSGEESDCSSRSSESTTSSSRRSTAGSTSGPDGCTNNNNNSDCNNQSLPTPSSTSNNAAGANSAYDTTMTRLVVPLQAMI